MGLGPPTSIRCDDTIASTSLGFEQRHIRSTQQRIDCVARLVLGHSDAARRLDNGPFAGLDAYSRNRLPQMFRRLQCVLKLAVHQKSEFFAAQSTDRMKSSIGSFARDRDEHFVARVMTMPIIHRFEVIDIDHQGGRLLSGGQTPPDLSRMLEETPPIQSAG
jgi:hypothetical protein